jgi:hypothetical protein
MGTYSLSVTKCRRVGHQVQLLTFFDKEGNEVKINNPIDARSADGT